MPSNPRKANGHRRRQVCARVYREESNCGICGRPVDKQLPYIDPVTNKPHPWAKTVDEIIPVSLGGDPYARSNCRLAHRRRLQHQARQRHVQVHDRITT